MNKIITRQIQEKKPRCTAENAANVCTDDGEIYCNIEFGLCAECLVSIQCTSEERPVCNSAGKCVPCSEDQNPCTNENDLSLINRPVCDDSGQCKKCTSNDQCTLAETPVCANDNSGKCVPCNNGNPCSGDLTCEIGKCIECSTYSECTDEDKPVCNANGQCVSCGLYEDQCPTEEYPVCSFGKCLACSDDDGRACPYATEGQVCKVQGMDSICLFECEDSSNACPERKPICNQGLQKCEICRSNDECATEQGKAICDTDTGMCVECDETENQCPENKPVCMNGQQCMACDVITMNCPDSAQTCKTDGTCVFECQDSLQDCPADQRPFCNTAVSECRKCANDPECTIRGPNWKCNLSSGKCIEDENIYRLLDLNRKYGNLSRQANPVECTTPENCEDLYSEKTKCSDDNTCVECLTSADCDPRIGSCIEGVCTNSCTAHNQCVHPAKLRCNLVTRQCEGGDFLAAFTLRSLAENAIKNRMDNTEQGITNAQTSGTSVAQIYGDTR